MACAPEVFVQAVIVKLGDGAVSHRQWCWALV